MFFTTLLIVILSILIYLWHLNNKEKYRDIEKIPGPKTRFLIGNVLDLGSNVTDIFYNFQKLIKDYGPLVRIWVGPFRLHLFITDLKYLEFFLSSSDFIKKSSGYDLVKPWLGEGLVLSSGHKWKKDRKLITPALHFKVLEESFDAFNKSAAILVEKLRKEVGKSIDILPFLSLYALEVICESTMRMDANFQDNADKTIIDAITDYLEINIMRFYSVFYRNDFLFKFSSQCKRQEECVKILHAFTRNVIKQRKEERLLRDVKQRVDGFGTKRKQAFLDILLDSNELTDEEVREQVDTFLVAGHDTVTTATSFGIYELAKHQDIQKLILEEIEEVVGVDKSTPITLNHMQEMAYLDRVMKEILRMHSPAPLFERELEQDVTFDGIKIPKGTNLTFHPYAQHHNEKLFPDPDKFDPDRFLPENVAQRHPFAYIPFSAGPRNCIGYRFALMNCKTAIAYVLRNFEVHPVAEHKPVLGMASVLLSLNGLPIILTSRE